MTNTIEANLISGRTFMQGVAIEGHKHEDEYVKACGICEIDVSDLKKLKVYPGQSVRVKSDYGSVVVRAVKATPGSSPWAGFYSYGAVG